MTQQTNGAVLTAEDVVDRLSLMSVSTLCDLHPTEARQWLEAVRLVVRQRNDAVRERRESVDQAGLDRAAVSAAVDAAIERARDRRLAAELVVDERERGRR